MWLLGSKLHTQQNVSSISQPNWKLPTFISSGRNCPTPKRRLRAQVVSKCRLSGTALHSLCLNLSTQINEQIKLARTTPHFICVRDCTIRSRLFGHCHIFTYNLFIKRSVPRLSRSFRASSRGNMFDRACKDTKA